MKFVWFLLEIENDSFESRIIVKIIAKVITKIIKSQIDKRQHFLLFLIVFEKIKLYFGEI